MRLCGCGLWGVGHNKTAFASGELINNLMPPDMLVYSYTAGISVALGAQARQTVSSPLHLPTHLACTPMISVTALRVLLMLVWVYPARPAGNAQCNILVVETGIIPCYFQQAVALEWQRWPYYVCYCICGLAYGSRDQCYVNKLWVPQGAGFVLHLW
jgi:hypothetical protein